MIKTLLGPELFRKGMDLYFTRHDGEAATVEQFVQCFADASGRDFSQFMRWYSQAGTPEVVVTPHYDARAKTYRLDIAQTVPPTPGQPHKEPMVIPLAVGLVGKNWRRPAAHRSTASPLDRGVLELTRPSQTFVFTGDRRAADPVVQSRLFGADQTYRCRSSRTTCASSPPTIRDPFNRWQAVQTLAMSLLKHNVAALRAGAPARGRRRPDGRAWRDSWRTTSLSPPSSRWRWRRRAKPTSRARSAATSIRTPYSPRGERLRAAIGERHGRAWPTPMRA